ncbi:hypothetical protein ATI61_111300 [Archangium gephyra]|uniref:Uncharacterized protein n=1 Tax=Archangium gephyra TaxID=48 RepID=A0ABX9JTF6_9BACT|nr:hypothetical protein ATI61_111300 [Archangium gephyra]
MTVPITPRPPGEGRGEGIEDRGFPSCGTRRVPGKDEGRWFFSGDEDVSGSGRKESPRVRVKPASRGGPVRGAVGMAPPSRGATGASRRARPDTGAAVSRAGGGRGTGPPVRGAVLGAEAGAGAECRTTGAAFTEGRRTELRTGRALTGASRPGGEGFEKGTRGRDGGVGTAPMTGMGSRRGGATGASDSSSSNPSSRCGAPRRTRSTQSAGGPRRVDRTSCLQCSGGPPSGRGTSPAPPERESSTGNSTEGSFRTDSAQPFTHRATARTRALPRLLSAPSAATVDGLEDERDGLDGHHLPQRIQRRALPP